MEIDEELLRAAVEAFGDRAQTDIMGEECTELADIINKFRRGRVDMDKMIDEIADVFIVIHYGPILFDKEAIQRRINFKMARLRDRVDDQQEELSLVGKQNTNPLSSFITTK